MNKTRERVWFFFILEFFVAAFCLFFGFEEQSIVALLASALVVACSLTAKLLLELLKAPWWLGALCTAVCVATIFVFAADMALPMASLLLLDVLSRLSWRSALHVAVLLSATATLLLALLFFPKPAAILGTTGAFALACVGLVLARLLERSRFDIGERDERILSLEARLKNQRTAISSIEQQGRQAERNRLAARIHDKVGHGMTGSILMLEAAQLQLDDDPKAARESIRAATENLRAGVEDIRQELREERSS
ncbi:MAG: histidine kinase dimerization/phosphoacceptor domain-containing protein, partial [Coriobacteriales bacterium]|nr:histidine kinase dimerization/phosphoacceptor domain-containing protein [Coriobacteriales bacterium]